MINEQTKEEMADYVIAAWPTIDRAEVFEFIPGTVSVFLVTHWIAGPYCASPEAKTRFVESLLPDVYDSLSYIFGIDSLEVTLFDSQGAPSNE